MGQGSSPVFYLSWGVVFDIVRLSRRIVAHMSDHLGPRRQDKLLRSA